MLSPGDRLADFLLPDQRRDANPFSGLVRGAPAVVHLFPGFAKKAYAGEFEGLVAASPALKAAGAEIYAISTDPLERNIAEAEARGIDFPLLTDPLGHVHRELGVTPLDPKKPNLQESVVTYLLDPTQRLIAAWSGRGKGAHADLVRGALDALPQAGPSRVITNQAPILLVPRVLTPDQCRQLMDIWQQDNEPSGTITMGAKGEERVFRDHVKRRRDHHVTDPKLFAMLEQQVLRRVAPEIERAFDRQVAKVEEFKIVRYDAEEGGFFRPHRDNIITERAQRRFAMTLNLNTGEYEGGELRFPEYGDDLYRPGAGDAAIFSCSLLHEATDVTRGSRYTLLSFLLDSQPAKWQAAYANWFNGRRQRLEQSIAQQAQITRARR
jgi:peroxiredoxin/predicted 2-oxoglutarate/Fe(II)-dependent dioxygenase YbiX